VAGPAGYDPDPTVVSRAAEIAAWTGGGEIAATAHDDAGLAHVDEADLAARLEEVRGKLAAAQAAGDERVTRSLQDSVADHELRLDNYRKAAKDAQFVSVELDRIENKIQALVELGVGSQDPDFLSDQVTAAAESMQHTEATVNQLQHLTGLEDQLDDPPPILEADLGRLTTRER
jgi:hypothetical protein